MALLTGGPHPLAASVPTVWRQGSSFSSQDVRQEAASCSDSSFVGVKSVHRNPDKMGFLLFLMAAKTASKGCSLLFAHAPRFFVLFSRVPGIFRHLAFRTLLSCRGEKKKRKTRILNLILGSIVINQAISNHKWNSSEKSLKYT